MTDKFDLAQLKEAYGILQNKYNLPSFEKLNEDFQIEKAAELETDFVLREVRKYITDKLINYLRFIDSILNPVNVPIFVFSMAKTLGVKEREKLAELYKKLAKVEIELIELDIEYSEEKEAEAIKSYVSLWKEIKKDISEVVGVIKKNWDAKIEGNVKGYFG